MGDNLDCFGSLASVVGVLEENEGKLYFLSLGRESGDHETDNPILKSRLRYLYADRQVGNI